MKLRSECTCICHKQPGVKHIMPCCTGTYELDPAIQASLEALSKLPEVVATVVAAPKVHTLPTQLPGEWIASFRRGASAGCYTTYVALYPRGEDYVIHYASWNDDLSPPQWEYHNGHYFHMSTPGNLEKAMKTFKEMISSISAL